MAEQIPIERLQPCLLDRLTDDEPDKREESRYQRVISHQKYLAGVRRDLEWLFNTEAYLGAEGLEPFQLKDYPQAFRSVVNYGTRQLSGMVTPDMARLEEQLSEAVRSFEPRLAARNLAIRADIEGHLVTFEIEGDVWANPLPEHLHFKSTLDLETGQLLGDAPHG